MKKYLLKFFLLGLLINPQMAQAAAFCLGGYGISPQCMYDDVSVCRRAAKPPDTVCVINPEAVLTYSGGSRYCTVSSSMVAECLYIDRSQCRQEAGLRNAVCIDRDGMADKYNPFKDDLRIQY